MCPRSATSAGRSSSTTAARATCSTATRRRPGRWSTSTTARWGPRSAAPTSTRWPSPTRSRHAGCRATLPRRNGPHREARPMTWSWPAQPRRVVVTGMGAVTALGNDVPSTWDGLLAGRSGVARITSFDPSRVAVQIAAEVKTSTRPASSTARTCGGWTATSSWRSSRAPGPGRARGSRPAGRRQAAQTGVILAPGLGGVSTLFDNVLLMPSGGPTGSRRSSSRWGSRNVGSGQVAIACRPSGPTSPPSPRAPPAAMRSARRRRRSAEAMPTS